MGAQSIESIDNYLNVFDEKLIDGVDRMDTYTRYMIGREVDQDSLYFGIILQKMITERGCNLSDKDKFTVMEKLNSLNY